MSYVSLYRKWRPQTFTDVVGQTHVVRTLSNALTEKRIAHAYLFTGPRGTGKTTLARLLAKGLNCAQGPTATPCGVCASCQRVAEGMAMDVVEIDGASNRGIDEMRDVRERVRFSPTEGKYKVYIIDEVHMLTTEAFNALLKVLEEPPAHVVFVFATTEPHKVPTTVTSRCQRFDFRRLAAEDALGRLQHVAAEEGIDVTPEALELIVRYADGSLRDGLGILEQGRAYAEHVTAAVVTDVLGVAPQEQIEAFATALAQADTAGGLALVKQLQVAGRDLRQFLRDAARYLRDVLLYKVGGPDGLGAVAGEERLAALNAHAQALPAQLLLRAIDTLAEAEGHMRGAVRSHLPLEMAIIRLTSDGGQTDATSPPVREQTDKMEGKDPGRATAPGSAEWSALVQRVTQLEKEVARLRRAAAPPGPALAAPAAPAPAAPSRPDRAGQEGPPAGAPSGGPAPAADGFADPLTAVRAQWDNLLEQLRRERALTVQAFLREGKPSRWIGDVLVVEFPANKGFHRANVAAPENAKIIERLLRGLLGRSVRLEAVLEGEAPAAAGESAEPLAAGAQNPLVRNALELFGGTVVAVEPPERRGDDDNND